MKTRIMCMCALMAALMISPAMAQEESAAAGPNTGAVSFGLGVDFTTAYFYRGLVQENQGLITQPWADVSFQLNDALSVYMGTWNSVHDGPSSGSGSNDDQWYESDFYIGASYALSQCVSLDLSYVWLYGPAGGAEFAEEINVALAYDDSGMWGDSFDGLQPHFLVAFETSGASDGIGLEGKGVYYELGIAPSFTVVDSATSPITLTIPVTLGLGSDYYEVGNDDDSFGYVDAGLDFSMPLSFVPARFGSWEAAAGVHFLFLGDNAETINGSVAGIGSGDDFEVIGTFGISMSY